jgi:hypothetical protein
MRHLLAAALCIAMASSGGAQTGISIPIAGGGTITTKAFPLPDGTRVPGSARVGADGREKGTTVNPDVVSIGGIASGLAFGAQCAVIPAGDAVWAIGGTQWLPCTPTGRLRVGLSSAAQLGGTLAGYSDLAGYQAADGTQKPGNLDAGGNVRTADGANASYSTVQDQSSAATYSFVGATNGAANVAAARRWWANCPANTTITVTLTLAGGGTRPVTLFDGPSGDSERISGFSGNTGANGACTIGIEG